MGRHLTPKAVSVDWADMKKCTFDQFIVIEEEHKIVTDTKASWHLSEPLVFIFRTKPQFSIEGGRAPESYLGADSADYSRGGEAVFVYLFMFLVLDDCLIFYLY
jgi:hypothetical protein